LIITALFVTMRNINLNKKSMEFPIYKEKDLVRDVMDGSYYNSDFAQLFQDLLDRDQFENDIEKGIAAQIVAEGTYNLSEKQLWHAQQVFERYNSERCTVCGELIPLNEVLYLDNGLCSPHQNIFDED
jgi:hypothetical protein